MSVICQNHAEVEFVKVTDGGLLIEDRHCSFSSDRRWRLIDAFLDRRGTRALMFHRWLGSSLVRISWLYSLKKRGWGRIRWELHPYRDHIGDTVCLDSVHNGVRQMHPLDLSSMVSEV